MRAPSSPKEGLLAVPDKRVYTCTYVIDSCVHLHVDSHKVHACAATAVYIYTYIHIHICVHISIQRYVDADSICDARHILA